MRTQRCMTVAVVAGTLALALPCAGWAKANKTGAAAKPSASSAQFMRNAAVGGMAEVKLGKLAEERASRDDVKSFGKRMVDDHSKANDELKNLASEKDVTLPSDVDAKHKSVYDRLSKLSGPAFDRAYMDAMVKDHHEDVAEFQKAARSADDPDVKGFASRTLPTLEEHMSEAQRIASGGSTRSAR